ncbi:hypothetical protein FIBSPDRAFT_964012 [Athelia psychrophila]|uniref:NACHT domain-containing protein n=1 Tax=Athelia psychrophila TaxID=1759441 RepID=A0A165YBJ5_9AGAM|nr:hypothetical protein FIBSPDRAFT_964012 [Fibularhizoctonia sp. CBS 109695]
MDNERNWQEAQNWNARTFLTVDTSAGANVTNIGGNYVSTNNHNINFGMGGIGLYPNFVVPDAGYQSNGSRSGCLEGTRGGIIAMIRNWKDQIDAMPIVWLSGPAGFGKSAISQTVAELCARDGTLIASFFFLRGAGGRSEFTRFITTLSFQITISIPETKAIIEKALQDDPTIPHQSIANQLQKLVLGPLASVTATHSSTRPLIIVIDALDECNDKRAVQDFIGILADAASAGGLPLRWLITSRREEHINQAFSGDTAGATTSRVSLEDFDAARDIEAFLKHRFSEILMHNPRLMLGISLPWPSIEEIRALVKKAERMFVFASTLVDFITDGAAPPQQKLRSVLSLHAGLDPLYVQVLGAVPDMPYFRRVLTTLMLAREQPSITVLADLLCLGVEDVLHTLNFIQSIIHVPADDITPVQLNHTSLRDFLVDGSRSYGLFIDPPSAAHFTLAADCLKHMNGTFRHDVFPDNAGSLYAMEYWVGHLQDSAVASEAFPELLRTLDDFVASEVMEVWINWLILNWKTEETQQLLTTLIDKYQGDAGCMYVNVRVSLEEDHQKGRRGCIPVRNPGNITAITKNRVGQTPHLVFSFAIERDVLSKSPGLFPNRHTHASESPSCTIFAAPSTLKMTLRRLGHKADLQRALPSELNVEDIKDVLSSGSAPAVFIPSQRVGASLLPIPQDHITHLPGYAVPSCAELVVHIQAGTDVGATPAVYNFLFFGGDLLLLGGLSDFHEQSVASLVQVEIGARLMDTKLRGMRAAFDEDGPHGTDSKARLAQDYAEPARELMVQIIPILFFCTLKAAYGLLIVLWLLAVLFPPINNMICWEKRT